MIKDIKVYSWSDCSRTGFILTKLLTTESSYSVVTSLVKEYAKNPLSVCKAHVRSVRRNIIGLDETDWLSIEEMISGLHEDTDMDPGLLLGISLSICKAAFGGDLWRIESVREKMKFPSVFLSIIRGRVSKSGADWKSFMVAPKKPASAEDMHDILCDVWSIAGEELNKKGVLVGKDLQNRWISTLSTEDTFKFLGGLCGEYNLMLAADCGLWKAEKGFYDYKNEHRKLTEEAQEMMVKDMSERFGLEFVENPFAPGSYEKKEMGRKLKIIADISVEPSIKDALNNESISGFSIKPSLFYNYSDMKSFSEVIAKKEKISIFPSPSFSFYDPWIADIAIAMEVPIITATPADGMGILNRLRELWQDVPHETI